MRLVEELRLAAISCGNAVLGDLLRRAAAEIARQDDVHLNSPGVLPPVDCPLVIRATGKLTYPSGEEVEITEMLILASRPSFVARRGDDIEYRTPAGASISGRFPWTYP